MNRTVEGSGTLNTKWKTTIMTATTLKELRTQKAGQQSLHDIRLKSTTFVTFTYLLPLIYITNWVLELVVLTIADEIRDKVY